MRKLMALAIVFTLAGATRSWALFGLGDVSFDGSLEYSGNSANNETDQGTLVTNPRSDHRGATATRVRVGMNAQVTEGVKSRLEVVRSPSDSGDSDTMFGGDGRPTSVSSEEGNFFFHNAYVEIENLWDHMVRVGRQYVGNAGDLVWNISPTNDDSLSINSIDGLLVQCRKYDFIHADLFTGKAFEDDAVANTDNNVGEDGDINLSSLDLVFPTLVPNSKVNVGYLWGVDSNTGAGKDDNKLSTIRAGINGSAKDNFITYRAEYFMNGGELESLNGSATDYAGNAIDLGIGVNPAETGVGTFSIWANWLMASGDDNPANTDDDSFHDFTALGANTSDRLLGEIFGKSNTLTGAGLGPIGAAKAAVSAPLGKGLDSGVQGRGLEVINIGASLKPKISEKSTVRLDYYVFNQPEDTIATVNVGDKFGTEIDLSWAYAHSDNVGLELGYAMFSPDDALIGVGATNDEDVTKLFARGKIKWGGQ
jgi:hypothetical protein